jgi:hypothetical protein
LAALGSGLGWLQLVFNWTPRPITPIDFWLIDSYVFFSLSLFPHFTFVTAAMCLALRWWLEFLEAQDWKRIIAIGLIAIIVQFVNPIAFATVDASFLGSALFGWWRDRKIRRGEILALLAVALFQMPLLLYNFTVLSRDPLWSQFTAQNQTLSPSPEYYIWGFAFFWPLALPGFIMAFRSKQNALGAAVFWVMSGFALAYAPFYIQRRFLQNITIPLAILATAGLIGLLQQATIRAPGLTRWRFSLTALLLVLSSLSSLQLGLSQVAYLQTHPQTLYYPASLDLAVDWFREHAQYNDFVLASEQTSQVLAQKAGLRVYLGHEMETLSYKDKSRQVQTFFRGESPEIAVKPVAWVVYGPLERQLGPGFKIPDNTQLVYNSPDLQIYQVK